MANDMTAFCIARCYKQPYTIHSSGETITIRGVTFDYLEMSAHCQVCGAPVYVPEINNANVQAREEGYSNPQRFTNIRFKDMAGA